MLRMLQHTVQRETIEGEFCGLWLLRKFSWQNLGAWHLLARQKGATRESFLRKNRISSIPKSVLPQNICTIWYCTSCRITCTLYGSYVITQLYIHVVVMRL